MYGEECFNLCSDFTSSPSSTPFPSGFECSFNSSNFKSKRVAYNNPPSSWVWDFLGTCTISEEDESSEYLNELLEYQIAIQSLLIGVILGSCFVGIIRYAL